MTNKPREFALPDHSRLAPLYPGADLADAYAVAVPPDSSADVAELARAVLAEPPGWVKPLMAARDGIMRWFGVKTVQKIVEGSARRGRETIGFFPVRERLDDEVVLGEDDRHLDFRSSFLVRQDAAGSRELVWVTVVHCRNRLGRLYLAAIGPFHRMIVPAYLARLTRGAR